MYMVTSKPKRRSVAAGVVQAMLFLLKFKLEVPNLVKDSGDVCIAVPVKLNP